MEIASARGASIRWLPLGTVLGVLALGGGGCRRHPASPAADAGRPGALATAYLRGLILDQREHPVPDAHVLVFAPGGRAAAPPRAITDRDGHFAVEKLVPGSYRALVEAAGFPPVESALLAAPSADVRIRLDGEGRSIVGRVELGGAPAAGARVELGAELGGPIRRVEARPDGGFVFGALGAGNYLLRAVRAGFVSPTARAEAAGRGGSSEPLHLVLERGRTIAGRVIDDAGHGLPGLEVRAEAADLPPGEDPLPTVTHSAGGGGFESGPFLPGNYRLSASRAGYLLRRAVTVELGAQGAAPAPVVLELLRGARLSGRAVDARGAPVASARVRCVASAIDDLTVQSGPLPPAVEAAAAPPGAGGALGSTRTATTDAAGRFSVADLIPGRYRVELAHAGLEPTRTDELTLAPGEHRDLGALALRDGYPVGGRVIDDGGNPIEGARVAASGAGPGDSVGDLYTITDGGGGFSLALPSGHYRLSASAAGHGVAHAEADVRPGGPAPTLEMKLVRAEAVLEGLVRDAAGRPLARARLVARTRDGASPGAEASALGYATADVGGHFRMADLPAGELRLEVQHPDYPVTDSPATPGQYAVVTVPLPGAIAGEAHVRATGAVVGRGRVDAAGPEGAKATAEIQRAGGFRLPRLRPGHWRLDVTAPGFRPAEQELDVPPSATLGEPSVSGLRVDLDPT